MKFIKHSFIILLSLCNVKVEATTLKIINGDQYTQKYCIASIKKNSAMWLLDTRKRNSAQLDKGEYSVVVNLYKNENDPYPIQLVDNSMNLENDGDLVVDFNNQTIEFYLLAN